MVSRSDPDTEDTEARPYEDDIAIVGLACRLPQAPSPAAFWQLLRDGVNVITQMPTDRFNARPDPESGGVAGSSAQQAVPYGGFLDQVDGFDAAFFAISPREAAAMDPRQRLMLELSWESLEDAGIVPNALNGSRTGVFVGAIGDDYAALHTHHGLAAITPHTMTGLHRSIIANRVSYLLGLRGPSLAIDAGQSSARSRARPQMRRRIRRSRSDCVQEKRE